MIIEVAKHTGFCMGVRKGVTKIVSELNKSEEDILVLGPLIHNPQTTEILSKRGLRIISDLKGIDNKTVAIRTHGLPSDIFQNIKEKSKRHINLTCSKVAKVHGLVKKYSKLGYFTIIIGDENHAEVEGIKSHASRGYKIISNTGEIKKVPPADKYIVVAQTTLDEKTFNGVITVLKEKLKNIRIFNTICESTHNRQLDVLQAIQRGIDALVVVGGKNSANTKRLAQIGTMNSIKTFHVENEDELEDGDFENIKHVLVTAGASTPNWIVNNALEKLSTISFKNKTIFASALKTFF